MGSMGVLLSDIKEVGSLASSVFKLGESLYDDAPQTLWELQGLLISAQRKCLAWETRARRYGLKSDETLRSSLRRAKKELQREESRLKGLDGGFGRLCLGLRLSSGTRVPEQLKESIVDLNEAIPTIWKSEDDVEEAARQRAKRLAKAPVFGFKRDRRYVRIPNIEDKLKDFLNHEFKGPREAQIVLLHGRAGVGKSSMARHLALDYQEAALLYDEEVAPYRDEASTSKKDGAPTSNEKCFKFDQVHFLSCGPDADWKKKQAELLDMLAWAAGTSEKNIVREINSKQEDDDDAVKEVESLLIQLLKDSVSFIIFDDVWDGTFLNRMVGVCGRHVKVLVTSQKRSLSDVVISSTEPLSISMDQLAPEDSFRILMVLTGFRDENMIPEDVKECMKQLVEKVKGHPYALASFATGIDANHNEELPQWQDVINTYDEYLETSSDPDHPLHGVSYDQSVFGAIQVKFESLGEEEKGLLSLMVMLRGPLVHQEVIQYFHQLVKKSYHSHRIRDVKESSKIFRSARKRMEDLQWIKIRDHLETKTWSIHLLDERFIQSKLDKNIQRILVAVQNLPIAIVQALKEEVQPGTAVKLLVASYFRDDFAQKIDTRFHMLRGNAWWFEYMGISDKGIHLQVCMPENLLDVQSMINKNVDSLPLIISSLRSTNTRGTPFLNVSRREAYDVREYHNVIANGLRTFLQLDPEFLAREGRPGNKRIVWSYERHWGDAVEKLGDRSKADGLFSDLPDQFWYMERGTVKRVMGDLSGALEDLDTAFQLDPENYEVLKQRGYVKFLRGDMDGARADAERAIPLKPSQHDRKLRKHVWYDPFHGGSWVIYVQPGALEKEALERAFQAEPEDSETLERRAYVKLLMGDDDGALADASKAAYKHEHEPQEPDFYSTSTVDYLGFQL